MLRGGSVVILALLSVHYLHLHWHARNEYQCYNVLGGIAIDLESVCRPGPHLYSEHNARFDDGRDDLQRSESVPSGQCAKGDLHLYRDAHYDAQFDGVHDGSRINEQSVLWAAGLMRT